MDPEDPRSIRSRSALLDAARRLLGERGPAGVTVDAVAAHARLARSTLYRHYPDVADLLAEAVTSVAPAGVAVDTGSVVEDLSAVLGGLAENLSSGPWAELMPAMLLTAERDARSAQALATFVAERRQFLVAVLGAGRDRGELPAGTDVEALADLLAGAVYYRRLMRRTPTSPEDVAALVRSVVPVARTAHHAANSPGAAIPSP